MERYTVETHDICAQAISFSLEDGKIYDVMFHGGCPGNTLAISKLIQGYEAQKVVDILKGNDCGGRGTSCADQLARGVEEAILKSDIKSGKV